MDAKKQNLTMENRKRLTITGVRDVGKYNDVSITLYTELGKLSIKGAGMKMKRVDVETGIAEVEGTFNAFQYLNNKAPKKLFERLR